MEKKNVFMNRSAIALANALQSPDILSALSAHGIGEEQLRFAQTHLLHVQQLDHQYHDTAAEAKAATQSLHSVWEQAQTLYGQHVVLGRVALKDQPTLLEKMQLDRPRKKRLAEWMTQANHFYRHAEALKKTLTPFGITTKELGEMQKLLTQMVEMQELQLQLKGRMQVVSEQKKLAYATLKRSVSRFFRIARIALDEEPQQLEVLGLVVKA